MLPGALKIAKTLIQAYSHIFMRRDTFQSFFRKLDSLVAHVKNNLKNNWITENTKIQHSEKWGQWLLWGPRVYFWGIWVYYTIALTAHASKVMLKILNARFQQYVKWELPDVQDGFRKAEVPEIKWSTSVGSSKRLENFRKKKSIYFYFIDYAKAFDCVDYNKLWNILKRNGNTRLPYLPSEKHVCRSRSNS